MTFAKPQGYVILEGMTGHPLANRSGRVPRHRLVCWQALGEPTSSPCTWCGYVLPWKTDEEPAFRHNVNVDHLNSVPGDDRAVNLAPSCWWCNTNRSWAPALAPQWWDRMRRWFAQVHPAERPNMPAMVGEVIGIHPKFLVSGLLTPTLPDLATTSPASPSGGQRADLDATSPGGYVVPPGGGKVGEPPVPTPEEDEEHHLAVEPGEVEDAILNLLGSREFKASDLDRYLLRDHPQWTRNAVRIAVTNLVGSGRVQFRLGAHRQRIYSAVHEVTRR